MAKKNKMKTHKGSAKVFRKRKSGSIKITRQGILHNTGKNSAKRSRQKRNGQERIMNTVKRERTLHLQSFTTYVSYTLHLFCLSHFQN